VEPAFAAEVDWLLCDALARLGAPSGESTYLRLSTRPVDQSLLAPVLERLGADGLRPQVLAGGYRLVERAPAGDRPGVTIVTTGAMVPEAVAAGEALEHEGVDATVVHLTSADRVFRAWQDARRRAIETGSPAVPTTHLDELIPPGERHRPVVSVHDAASHALAWIGSAVGTRQLPLGVDRFGESGTIADLHALTGISTAHVVNAALIMTAQR
jgi:pyruvate dehydrogenase E1 component